MHDLGVATTAKFNSIESDLAARGKLYLEAIASVDKGIVKLQLSVGAAIIVGLLGILFRKFAVL